MRDLETIDAAITAAETGHLVFGTPESPRFARLVQYTTEGVGRDVHYLFRADTVAVGANDVIGRPGPNNNTVREIPDRGHTRDIRADVVSGDAIVVGPPADVV